MKQKTALKFRGVSAVGGTLNEAAVAFAGIILGKSRQLIVSSDKGVYAVNPLPGVRFFDPKLGVEHSKVLTKELNLVLSSDNGDESEGIQAYTAVCSECDEVTLTERKLDNCLLCGSAIAESSYEPIELQMPNAEEMQVAQASDDCKLTVTEASDEEEEEEEEVVEDDDEEVVEDDEEEVVEDDEEAVEDDEEAVEDDDSEIVEDDDEEEVVEDDDDSEIVAGDDCEGDDCDDEDDIEIEESSDDEDDEEIEIEESSDEDDIELPEDDEDSEESSDEDSEESSDEDSEESSDEEAYYINDEGSVDIDMVNDTAAEDGDVVDVEYSCSSSGKKRWIASVDGQPVSQVVESSAGKNKAIFHTEAFAKVASAVLASDGIKGLASLGFTPFVIQAPIKSLIASQVASETASVVAGFKKQSEALAKDYASSLCVAAAGINRGFFEGVVNPLKLKVWEELSSLSIPSPERIIDRCFKETAEAFCEMLIEKASELHAKPRDIRIALSTAIAGTAYLNVTAEDEESSDDSDSVGAAIASQLESAAIPFSSFSQETRVAETASASTGFDADLHSVMNTL